MKFNKLFLSTVLAVTTVSFANAQSLFDNLTVTPKVGTQFYSADLTTKVDNSPVVSAQSKGLGGFYLGADLDLMKLSDFTVGADLGYLSTPFAGPISLSTLQLGASVKYNPEAFKSQYGQTYLNGSLGYSNNSLDKLSYGKLYYKAGVGLAMPNNLDFNLAYTGSSKTDKASSNTTVVSSTLDVHSVIFSVGYKLNFK